MNKNSLFSTSFNSGASATVIWDLELCPLPQNFKGYQAVRLIKDFVLAKGLQLTQIMAIGSSRVQIRRSELEDCGVNYQKLHSKSPAAADISILHEIIKLVYFHRPPHSIVLITGDRDFSKILNFLDQVHYHVIYIHAKDMSDVMQFSINDRTPWWEVLGCKESDIDFLSPYTLEDVANPSSNTIPLTTNISSKQSASTSSKTISAKTSSSAEGSASPVPSTAALSHKLQKADSISSSKTDKLVSSSAGATTAAKPALVLQKAVNGSQATLSNPTAPTPNLVKQQRSQSCLQTVNYDVLIDFLRTQENFVSYFGEIGTHCLKIGPSNGFATLKDYMYQAEADGIVFLSNKDEPSGQVTVKLAPELCISKPPGTMFDELVTLLEASNTRSLTMSDIGMASRNINKRYGFAHLKSYLAVAEQVGIIKTRGREDRNGRIIVHLLKSKSEVAKCALAIEAALVGSNYNAALAKSESAADQRARGSGSASSSTPIAGNSAAVANATPTSTITTAAAAVRTSSFEYRKKALWDLFEFMRSMPNGQFVSAAHIVKYCPSILRKMNTDSFQSFLYSARSIGLIALTIEGGDDKDLAGFMVQLTVTDKHEVSAIFKNLEKQEVDVAEQQNQQKPVSVMTQKQPLFVPSAATSSSAASVLAPGDLELPKSSRISIRPPPGANPVTAVAKPAPSPPSPFTPLAEATKQPANDISKPASPPTVPTLLVDSIEKKDDMPVDTKGSFEKTLVDLPDSATAKSPVMADVARAVEPETANSKPFSLSNAPSVFYASVGSAAAVASVDDKVPSVETESAKPALQQEDLHCMSNESVKTNPAACVQPVESSASPIGVEKSVSETDQVFADPLYLLKQEQRQLECDESSGYSSEPVVEVKYGLGRFFWPHPGNSVAVTGSWDHWNSETLMVNQGGVWHLEKTLPVGRYEYEFVVDGNQMVDDNQQYVEDDESCHNLVFVA